MSESAAAAVAAVAPRIAFVGSSILAFWKALPAHMAPLPVVNLAVAGARTDDVLRDAGALVGPAPAAVYVYYAGSNDLLCGDAPLDVAARTAAFAALLDERSRLVIVSALRSPDREAWAHRVTEYNDACERLCRSAPHRREFVDVNGVVEGRPAMFKADGIHLRKAGYAAMAGVLRPVLERQWDAATRAAASARL